jgi:hypothetical protein
MMTMCAEAGAAAGPAGGGVRPEQYLLGSDAGRLADAPQAFGRVAA